MQPLQQRKAFRKHIDLLCDILGIIHSPCDRRGVLERLDSLCYTASMASLRALPSVRACDKRCKSATRASVASLPSLCPVARARPSTLIQPGRRQAVIMAGQFQRGNQATVRRTSGPPNLPPVDSNVSCGLADAAKLWKGLLRRRASFSVAQRSFDLSKLPTCC